MNVTVGDWTLGNINMASALKYARYDYRFEMGTGGHDLIHAGAILPEMLRWIWRDYPGVKGAGDAPNFDAVIGQWDVVTNILGEVGHSVLTVTTQGDALAAKLNDREAGEIEVTAMSFEDDILSYEYVAPQSKSSWGKGSTNTMATWLRATEEGNVVAIPLLGGLHHRYERQAPWA